MLSSHKFFIASSILIYFSSITLSMEQQSADISPIFTQRNSGGQWSPNSKATDDSLTHSPLSRTSQTSNSSTNPLFSRNIVGATSYQDITDLLCSDKASNSNSSYSYASTQKDGSSFWSQRSVSTFFCRFLCCYNSTQSSDTN